MNVMWHDTYYNMLSSQRFLQQTIAHVLFENIIRNDFHLKIKNRQKLQNELKKTMENPLLIAVIYDHVMWFIYRFFSTGPFAKDIW